MEKIFKRRKDLKIFAGMAIVFVLLLFSFLAARGFENDWYNKDYDDYQENPGSYFVTEVPIKDFKTYSGFNDKALSYTDLYFTALVDITYAGGQTETYRVPAANGDKKGDKIKVAYDRMYDEDYEGKMQAVERNDGDPYQSAPRIGRVTNTKYSTGILVAVFILGAAMAVFVGLCIKRQAEDTEESE
ncbi:MAG: hypothetical protein GXY08_04480 [Ruminococcus sp.]|nr:hypothetical protein [Ruminococcus sp.]